MKTTVSSYTKDFVLSKDGTRIGYRQMGSGPGLVILHGGVNASQHMMKLGTALSDAFTVYIPDRRGRGMSGPVGNNYSIEREDEDLDALLKRTGAHLVFGAADGALFALHAALSLPAIHKVVTYEPVIFFDQPGLDQFRIAIKHFDQNISKGDVPLATVTLTKDEVEAARFLPDALLVPFVKLIFWLDNKKASDDYVPYSKLISPLREELLVVAQTEGTLESYKGVTADVLLLMGSKSYRFIMETSKALEKVLPHARLVELQGLNHDAAQDYGKPERLIPEIRRFLA